MRRPALGIVLGTCLLAAGCDGAWASVLLLIPAIGGLLLLSQAFEGIRRLYDPARYDPPARMLADAAQRLRLPAPRGATRLSWPLPCGLTAKAEASEHLELVVTMPQIPNTIAVDRPALPRGVALRQVRLPAGVLDGFGVRGPEAETIGLLADPVREALMAAAQPPLHVAIEQGALRVRLLPQESDLADDAAERLDLVARAVARLPDKLADRLADLATGDSPLPLRRRALAALVDRFSEHAQTAKAVAALREAGIEDENLRRWAGRHGKGALSLPAGDDPRGAVAVAPTAGALSSSED